jgi:dTDP-4-amino-4,6-dideoxygalactose transaminase
MMSIPAAKVYFPEEDRKQILQEIDGSLQTGMLTLNKYVKQFEEEFSKYVGTKYAVAVNGGTSALEISLRAHDVKGHSVIVPTNTFFATPGAVLHSGAKPIFTDIGEDLCMDPESLKESITEDTKAVIIVHIGGIITPKIGEIKGICEDNKLVLIEDAAHAHGSKLDGKMAGTFGKAAAFSFYPTKVMTSGEGGMVTTDDEAVYKRAITLRDQGKPDFSSNYHTEEGYNWRMSEIHAIIGIHQLRRLDEFIAVRQKAAKIYDEGMKGMKNVGAVKIPAGVFMNYYKYCALLKDRDVDKPALKKTLKEKFGVGLSGEVYEVPCHLQPIFKNMYGFKGGEFPVAEDLCARQICLPIFATMTDEQAHYVIDSIKEVIG